MMHESDAATQLARPPGGDGEHRGPFAHGQPIRLEPAAGAPAERSGLAAEPTPPPTDTLVGGPAATSDGIGVALVALALIALASLGAALPFATRRVRK